LLGRQLGKEIVTKLVEEERSILNFSVKPEKPVNRVSKGAAFGGS